MRAKEKNTVVLLIILLIGLVIGGVLGDVFDVLNYGKSIGFDPVLIDLSVIKLTIGLKMSINLASILGLCVAILVFRRL